MHFAHDTEEALEFAVELGNTDPVASRSGTDELATLDQLAEFLAQYPFSGRIDGDERERRDVLRARDQVRLVWALDRDDAVLQVNSMLAEAHALPYLARHDGSDWHLHATTPDAPLGERMRVEAALALTDVIRMDEMKRLRICEADDCEGLILDLSRNGSKRFCSARCGSRMNMIAFRKRKGAQA
ncbi:putative RNA-binding Zn ribbon-like protein [Cryobacterium sp. MP_M5]|uniref:CGNR zinc finger domain-containing protein n=1 Tax=unclassified Cryobacterium TaxID=2649013 RepID=UPI0018CB155D|nr:MULTISPECIES: CGNR zinc finger domain-containing protein [unclassified Cryobacterium]MBG6058023.1 putative RNA-binding Zn ribbon-like protein [Cryobacterium sp. MP_M3]MEC5176222.1 putative RNA-binding Zn ribbon-like protein [Cryobacterium sp. MP_M5]